MQPVDIKSKYIIATIVHDCYYLKEKCTHCETNPLTTVYYFITPTTNIAAIPAITQHWYDLPADKCFINELTTENRF